LLSSGITTWFSRSALLVLTGLTDIKTDFTQPLTFKPYSPSQDSKAVFCAIANSKNELGRYPDN
jgi:hypothetical protein